MPASLFVVAAALCILLDPRDPQQVIIAQGLPPHPGPEQGAVMQEVGGDHRRKVAAASRAETGALQEKTSVLTPLSGS